MSTIWCIIWRFQPLHNGHNLLIEASLANNDQNIIFIGSSNVINQQNPYNFEIRKKILQQNFQDNILDIHRLPDTQTDDIWIQNIILQIPITASLVKLYCGDQDKDSAIISIKNLRDILPFDIEIIEIPRSIIPISATQIRMALNNNNITFLKKYLSKTTINIVKNIS